MSETMTDEDILEALCHKMEPELPVISATAARAMHRNFQWVSCMDHHSPGGWWAAEIGTDHNQGGWSDDDPIQWRPVLELDAVFAFRVIEAMRTRNYQIDVTALWPRYSITFENPDEVRACEGAGDSWVGVRIMADDFSPRAVAEAALAALDAGGDR